MVGAGLGAEHGSLDDRCSLFTSNLQATYDYLDTAPNDQCYNDRFADVVSDTAIVNAMCELGGDPGAFVAGVYASKKADQYMDTSWKESLDLKFEGQAQLEIMRRDVRKRGGDPALVRGTGVWKQHLNPKLRSNLLAGPYSPGKRPIWAYKYIRPLGFVDVTMLAVRIPICTKAATAVLGERIFRTVLISVSIYLYYHYINYLYFRVRDTVTYIRIRMYIRNVSRRIGYRKQFRVQGLF